jgi:hypothetical protein
LRKALDHSQLFLDYSQPLDVAVKWSGHRLSEEPSLGERSLDREPRFLSRDEISGHVLPVKVDVEAVRWDWHKFDHVDYVGLNGVSGRIDRQSGNKGVRWSTVGASVELIPFDGPVSAATIYAAQPRIAPPAVRSYRPNANTLVLRVDWPRGVSPPTMRFYATEDRPLRLERRSEERGLRTDDTIEFRLPHIRDRIYAVLIGPAGELLYWKRFSEGRVGPVEDNHSAADQILIDYVARPNAASGHALPWPKGSRLRFEAIRRILKGSSFGQRENLGESRADDVTRAYRIALLKYFGVDIEGFVLADLGGEDFGEALSLLLSGIDVGKWSPEDIVWAMRQRSSSAFCPVVKMYPKADEAKRAFSVWEDLRTADDLLERFAADSPGRPDMAHFKKKLEAHVRKGLPKPATAWLWQWKERLDAEDRGDLLPDGVYHSTKAREAAELNEHLRSAWLSRLGILLVEWTTGRREHRDFDPQAIEKLIDRIEPPPFSTGDDVDIGSSIYSRDSVIDPWMANEARELETSAVNRHDPLVDSALRKLTSVIIENADRCSQFHAFVRSAETLAAPHPALRKRFSFDRSLSMKTLNESAIIVTKLVRSAERRVSTLPWFRSQLGSTLLNVLLQPSHQAVVELSGKMRSDLDRYEISHSFSFPAAFAAAADGEGAFETAIVNWWEQLACLECALCEASEKIERLQVIATSVWKLLRPLLMPVMHALRSSRTGKRWVSELEPLVQQASDGDPLAPKRICQILVEHPEWSRPLEAGANRRAYGRR